jgi:hypothetical protein
MTDDELRAIFDEFRRVGVDLERPPGLALGTGFRGGEFLTWLRALPDGLGHEAVVDRLNAHLAVAAPSPALENSKATFFTCATLDQLSAGIDVLTEEWDPLGARLGELSREDVAQHAFDIMNDVLVFGGHDPQSRVATLLGALEEREFGVRPSPMEQRRYLARRLMQVVVDHPAAPDEQDLWAAAGREVELGPRGDEPPALDAQAVCSECRATGTVAVVMREREPLMSRYCADCWRGARDKYWNRKPPTEGTSTPQGMIAAFDFMRSMMRERQRYAASALWEDQLETVRATLTIRDDCGDQESPDDREREVARLAHHLRDHAAEMVGPMPPEIADFMQQYAPPA